MFYRRNNVLCHLKKGIDIMHTSPTTIIYSILFLVSLLVIHYFLFKMGHSIRFMIAHIFKKRVAVFVLRLHIYDTKIFIVRILHNDI